MLRSVLITRDHESAPCLYGAESAPFDAGYLDISGHWIAREAKVTFKRGFRSIFDRLWRTAHNFGDHRRRHRRRHDNLGLAAALSPRQRCIVLAKIADSRTGEQTPPYLLLRSLAFAFNEAIDNCGHHAG